LRKLAIFRAQARCLYSSIIAKVSVSRHIA
jgi:hypothetical protein